jgi:hypothetical protein
VDNPYLYYLGLDLGQTRDYSALAVMEEQLFIAPAWASEVLYAQDLERGVSPGWVSPATLSPYQVGEALWHIQRFGRPAEVPLSVRYLERFELGTKYSSVVERVAEVVRSSPLRGMPAILLIDKTGVGASVLADGHSVFLHISELVVVRNPAA